VDIWQGIGSGQQNAGKGAGKSMIDPDFDHVIERLQREHEQRLIRGVWRVMWLVAIVFTLSLVGMWTIVSAIWQWAM